MCNEKDETTNEKRIQEEGGLEIKYDKQKK
jgi:hypothetical protein